MKIGNKTHLNFVESPVQLPPLSPSDEEHMHHDRLLYSQCVGTGKLPAIEWEEIKNQFRMKIQELSGDSDNTLSVTFLDVSSPDGLDGNDCIYPQPTTQNLDRLMEMERTEAIVIHDRSCVLFSTLSSDLCQKIRLGIAKKLGLEDVTRSNNFLAA
eukprot:scaffold72520_cov35-Attheya_sp.AAC.1